MEKSNLGLALVGLYTEGWLETYWVAIITISTNPVSLHMPITPAYYVVLLHKVLKYMM